jgi:hypothetical protein
MAFYMDEEDKRENEITSFKYKSVDMDTNEVGYLVETKD